MNKMYLLPKPRVGATALGGMIAGVVTGATIALVKSGKKVKTGEITPKEAGAEILREAGTMGFATSIGAAGTAALGLSGVLSIASLAFFTAGAKYGIETILEKSPNKNEQCCPAKNEVTHEQ